MELNKHLQPLFTPEDLNTLRAAFDEACEELDLLNTAPNSSRRDRLAKLVIDVAKHGERDPNRIVSRAVERFSADVQSLD